MPAEPRTKSLNEDREMKKANERLMLVTLGLHQWYPRKYDRKASEEVARNHGAASAEEVGRFNKILVEINSIKPLQQRIVRLRNDHYAMTAPWTDDGVRVLPAELYFDYSRMVQDARHEIDRLADDFAWNEYLRQREAAKVRLNGLFNENDYPTPDIVRSKFGVDVSFSPLPNANDARVWGIGDEAAAEIEAAVRASQDKATADAQKHVLDQVVARAREFVEKVSLYDKGDSKKLYATAVENLREVTDLVIRGLNITGDQQLEKLARDLSDSIADTNVERLKNGEGERKAKVQSVEQVLDRFQGVFS